MKELIYHRLLLPAVDTYADKVGFLDGDRRRTYGEHGDRVLRLAHALRHQLGVEPGQRFAVMATNSHEYLELYHAAFLGAGIINPLNLRLAGKELDYILRDSGTEVAFVDAFFAEHLARALDESDEPSPLRHLVLIGDADVPHDIRYDDLVDAGDAVVPDETEEDDPVVLMYTGGTTGLPKGVLLDQRAEMLNLYHIAMSISLDPDTVYLHQTPMFHAASMGGILGVPAAGGTSVFMPMFEPGAAMDVIERHQVTQTMMVPTMVAMVLNHPDYRPERVASLTQLTYGASPMPAAILDRLLAECPTLDVTQGYGMTESSSLLTWLDAADHRVGGPRLRSAGRPVPGVVLSIRDDDGNEVKRGETGEVWARAGNYMREYWNKHEATEEVFRGGWYHTGDAGFLDDGNYLFLVDRVKDMIVTGGENVYSTEVESAISRHEAVAQVAVIGIPHEVWGEQVHAIVVLHPGAEASEDEIREFAREHIAGYKVPKSVEFRTDPLPLSGALKVLKRELARPVLVGPHPGGQLIEHPVFGLDDVEAVVAHFRDRGWAHVRSPAGRAAAPDLARWATEISAWPDDGGDWLQHRELTDDGPVLCRTENIVPHHAGVRDLLCAGEMIELAGALLGEPAVLYKDKLNHKRPGGAGYAPHQDAPAYRFVDVHVSCMVAIDDATEANGCLEVVSAAHDRLWPTDDTGCIDPAVAADDDVGAGTAARRRHAVVPLPHAAPQRAQPIRPTAPGPVSHLQRRSPRATGARRTTARRPPSWPRPRRATGCRSRSSATSRDGPSGDLRRRGARALPALGPRALRRGRGPARPRPADGSPRRGGRGDGGDGGGRPPPRHRAPARAAR